MALSRSAVVTTTASTICGPGHGEQAASPVRFAFDKRKNGASRQETPELGLLWRSTDPRDHRRGDEWNDAHFESRLVICPRTLIVSIGGH
jgi:hypothetical protein